jgi:alpha-aminoadipate carrier protein LysW
MSVSAELIAAETLFYFSILNKGDKVMLQTECVECGAVLEVPADVMQGEILPCGECGAELEVISLEPLELEPAPLEMEDWGE